MASPRRIVFFELDKLHMPMSRLASDAGKIQQPHLSGNPVALPFGRSSIVFTVVHGGRHLL